MELDRNGDGKLDPKELNPSAASQGKSGKGQGQGLGGHHHRRGGGGGGDEQPDPDGGTNPDGTTNPDTQRQLKPCLTLLGPRPTSAPFRGMPRESARGGVAQLVRVTACHAVGRGFEPRRSRHSSPRSSENGSDRTRAGRAPRSAAMFPCTCKHGSRHPIVTAPEFPTENPL